MAITKNDIKELQSLRQAKGRRELGIFAVEGNKLVEELLKTKFRIDNIFVTGQWVEKNASFAKEITAYEVITAKQMEQITNFVTAPGIFATAAIPSFRITPKDAEHGLILMLDGINDPGNLGTILRIADWFGITSVVAAPDTVDIFNPKVVQSTMGAIFRVDFHYADLTSFAKDILHAGGHVYGTFLDGRNIYSRELETGDDSPAVIVIGNESNGISDAMAELVSDRLYIPPFPQGAQTSESLNAAVATAITVAEFRRRAWAR